MSKSFGLFTIMSRIDSMSNQFTKTDWKIYQFMKNNIDQFLQLNAQELGNAVGISDASIIRFSQKVGFSGLNEMRYSMQQEIAKSTSVSNHTDSFTLMRETQLLIENLYHIINPALIFNLRTKVNEAKRVFIVGLDYNACIADIIAHKFMLLGINIIAISNYDSIKLYRSLSSKDDLFITITYSGDHKILSSILSDIVNNGSSVVLVSNYEKSLCANYSDFVLLIPKTDSLLCSSVITREILLLTLFDLIFQNFITEDSTYLEVFQKTASYANSNPYDIITNFE